MRANGAINRNNLTTVAEVTTSLWLDITAPPGGRPPTDSIEEFLELTADTVPQSAEPEPAEPVVPVAPAETPAQATAPSSPPVVASGDDGVANFQARSNPGACGFNPSYPATCPYVTAVGANAPSFLARRCARLRSVICCVRLSSLRARRSRLIFLSCSVLTCR